MSTSWHSYPSIFALGHRAVARLLMVPHIIEEKIDGSQFSFGLIPANDSGELELRMKSKGAPIFIDAPPKMFQKAVDTVKDLEQRGLLTPGWTYRAEYLEKPKHNTLAYGRIPAGHLIIFDINPNEESYLGVTSKREEAQRLGLECVPTLAFDDVGNRTTLAQLRQIIDSTPSVLGEQLVEGIVVKPTIGLYGEDKKLLIGKFVSERFKEAHSKAWGESNPSKGDILDRLCQTYHAEGRWLKAIQHLREAGQLEMSPRDIGKLLKELNFDILKEEEIDIKERLFKWAWPHISRGATRGFPEFYKEWLLERQFDTPGVNADGPMPCQVEECPNDALSGKLRCVEHLPGTDEAVRQAAFEAFCQEECEL